MLASYHTLYSAFKKITAEQGARKDAERVLKRIDVFKSFTSDELTHLAAYLCEAKFGRKETIVKEGDKGDSLFIILPGGQCGKYHVSRLAQLNLFTSCLTTSCWYILEFVQNRYKRTKMAIKQKQI